MTVQTLDRSVQLLRLIAEAGTEGTRLVDLQRQTQLSKPTIHRLLKSLAGHALVSQMEGSRRYCIGPEIATLSWLSTRRLNALQHKCEEDLATLAETTGAATFLIVPWGQETICIDRHMGRRQTIFTVDVGVRCPLGVGANGIALLASMAPPLAEQIFEKSQSELARYPASLNKIRVAVSDARRSGYAFSDGAMQRGVRALAMTMRNSRGEVVASIGVASSSELVVESRIPELLHSLRSCVRKIERHLALSEPALQSRH
jgi:DNA-binding IclR family transcriptional regulator